MKVIRWLSVLLLIWLSGCAALPPERLSKSIQADELEAHVRFLSQPGLRGRKTGSWESPAVRRYLIERFEQYGLVPWGQAEGFVQDFRIGKNVIGVLPGSDPNLADEIILVSAHYDHLGAKLFKMYPGACDNASGVAALLEIAERMSRCGRKPRRSICFASFDAEEIMCIGSFAFTCREDYDDSKITAVINMDLLGRDFLEVVDNSLLVVGSEHFPQLYRQIEQFGRRQNLILLPFESVLVGPVGDHIAFLSPQRPVVFFTCGLYRDYHQPTDTADKLDYDKIRREAATVYDTLEYLANTETIEKSSAPNPADARSLHSLEIVLKAVDRHRKSFEFDPNDLQALRLAQKQVTKAIEQAPDTTSAQQIRTERKVLKKLLPLVQKSFPGIAGDVQIFLDMSELFSMYPEVLTDYYRDTLRKMLAQKPSLFKRPVIPDPLQLGHTDRDWGLTQDPNGLYLASFQSVLTVEAKYSILDSSVVIAIRTQFDICKGTPGEVADYVYLKLISGRRGIPEKSDSKEAADPNEESLDLNTAVARISDPNAGDVYWLRILERIPPADPNHPSRPLIETLYDEKDPNTLFGRWLPALCRSCNPYVAAAAIGISARIEGDDFLPLWIARLGDPNTPQQVWSSALSALCKHKTRRSLLAVTEVLDETTAFKPPTELLDRNFPLKEHPLVSQFLPEFKKAMKAEKPSTRGRTAAEQLREQTKKNFGTHKKRWQRWIRKHYPEK